MQRWGYKAPVSISVDPKITDPVSLPREYLVRVGFVMFGVLRPLTLDGHRFRSDWLFVSGVSVSEAKATISS